MRLNLTVRVGTESTGTVETNGSQFRLCLRQPHIIITKALVPGFFITRRRTIPEGSHTSFIVRISLGIDNPPTTVDFLHIKASCGLLLGTCDKATIFIGDSLIVTLCFYAWLILAHISHDAGIRFSPAGNRWKLARILHFDRTIRFTQK